MSKKKEEFNPEIVSEIVPTSHSLIVESKPEAYVYSAEHTTMTYCQLIDSIKNYFSVKEKSYIADIKNLYKQLLKDTQDTYTVMKIPFTDSEGNFSYFYGINYNHGESKDFEFPKHTQYFEFINQIENLKDAFAIIDSYPTIDHEINYLKNNLISFNETKRQTLKFDTQEKKRYIEIVSVFLDFVLFIEYLHSNKNYDKQLLIANTPIETRQTLLEIPNDLNSLITQNNSIQLASGGIASLNKESAKKIFNSFYEIDNNGNYVPKKTRKITGIKCQKFLDYIVYKYLSRNDKLPVVEITLDDAKLIFNRTNTTEVSAYIEDCNVLLEGLSYNITETKFYKGKSLTVKNLNPEGIKIADKIEYGTEEKTYIWKYYLSGLFCDMVNDKTSLKAMIPESAFKLSDEAYIIHKNIAIQYYRSEGRNEPNTFKIGTLLDIACIQRNTKKYSQLTITPLFNAIESIKDYFTYELMQGKKNKSYKLITKDEFNQIKKSKDKEECKCVFFKVEHSELKQIKKND